jgi:hypothetical protein
MNRSLLAITLLLLLPASANAAVPAQFCDSDRECFAPVSTDVLETIVVPATGKGWGFLHTSTGHHSLRGEGCDFIYATEQQWIDRGRPSGPTTCVYVGGEYVTSSYRRYAFPDIPAGDRQFFTPLVRGEYTELLSGGEPVSTLVNVISGGSTVDVYCRHYASGAPGEGTAALDTTPASVYAACGFTRHASDPAPQTTTPAPQTIVVPTNAARCGSVGKVTVRSTRVACASARSVIARYARSLRSPAGWSCTALVTDAGRRARCIRKVVARSTVARATIYGIWRP